MKDKNEPGKIVIVGSKETFMVKSMRDNLEKMTGHPTMFSVSDLQALTFFKDETDLYVLYMDGQIEELTKLLLYLKDVTIDDRMVVVIGDESEIKDVTKIIPEEHLSAIFHRPFDMHTFTDKIMDLLYEREAGYQKKSILIVDDDATFLRMVHSWLKEKYRVSIVNSGMQAITWLAKNKADLILLDYEMPVASGPNVLEMLQSELGTSEIPVMFLTGKSDRESVARVMGMKMERYLLKSIGKQGLLEEIDKFFIQQKL